MCLREILEGAINAPMRKKEMLSSQQVAIELNVPYSTIMLWLKQGRFSGAERDDTNPRGPVWLIPRSALVGFTVPKRGRPEKPKDEGEKKASTSKRAQTSRDN
jgi:hypothetical protein